MTKYPPIPFDPKTMRLAELVDLLEMWVILHPYEIFPTYAAVTMVNEAAHNLKKGTK